MPIHRRHAIPEPRRTWYRHAFLAAACYNALFGLLMMAAPRFTIWIAQAPIDRVGPIGVMFWQGVGLFVLLFAIGYWYCYRDPERYAAIILMASVGKVLGILGFLNAWLIQGTYPASAGVMTFFSDVVWLPLFIPFVYETIVQRRYEPR